MFTESIETVPVILGSTSLIFPISSNLKTNVTSSHIKKQQEGKIH